MKYKLFLFCLICFCGLNAQKTTNYFQYSFFPEITQQQSRSRTQPINNDQYYWLLNFIDVNNNGDNSLGNFDSISFIRKSIPNKHSVKISNSLPSPNLIFLMNQDKTSWNLLVNPLSLKQTIKFLNLKVINEDLYVYSYVWADSLKIQFNINQFNYIDIPNSEGYAIIKISKNGSVSLENFIASNQQSRLLFMDDKKYAVYFDINPFIPFNKYNLDSNVRKNLIHDSLLTGIILQYEFGSKSTKKWISGTLPCFIPLSGYCFMNASNKNKILIAGKYFGQNTIANFNLPFNPLYKINSNAIQPMAKPLNFNKNSSYLYWLILDIEKWTFDETKFSLVKGEKYWDLTDYGIINSKYWFFSPKISQIAIDQPTPNWITSNSIFIYNTQNQSFNSPEFPARTQKVMQDADSLLFLVGGLGSTVGPDYIDYDNSPYDHYTLKKGYFCAEYTPEGKLVWARNENLILNDFLPYNFTSDRNTRFLSTSQFYLNDLDLGFTKIQKNFLAAYAGSLSQISKAPICDFDIELITYNHVTINYKGALNANFYYKYGDGSKDSNYNQRNFIHSYKKTGTFLLYCIAKNDFGRDTAYYSVDIYDIVSTTKLNKNNTIKLYPNPTENTLRWDSETTQHVDIFDTNGRLIERIKTTQNTINIGHLLAGIYLVSVHTKDGSYINKVMKQ